MALNVLLRLCLTLKYIQAYYDLRGTGQAKFGQRMFFGSPIVKFPAEHQRELLKAFNTIASRSTHDFLISPEL
ncbi:hypothetical protein DEU56DRAFT_792761 [Suillus clintonianus]|uniref:uncharacterized protein n=1 Tax=Suillus clintonianus TaxID=1904413 RepID=UPI001B85F7F6|nr:uncharacterized protein DEU56DRAFT_792761 [Suillus clintonianus]KAG2142975.1 hypothetical protein DEU56DRAFT_792761 [Suillus clintonianus]